MYLKTDLMLAFICDNLIKTEQTKKLLLYPKLRIWGQSQQNQEWVVQDQFSSLHPGSVYPTVTPGLGKYCASLTFLWPRHEPYCTDKGGWEYMLFRQNQYDSKFADLQSAVPGFWGGGLPYLKICKRCKQDGMDFTDSNDNQMIKQKHPQFPTQELHQHMPDQGSNNKISCNVLKGDEVKRTNNHQITLGLLCTS